jgi:hypothetical protein
MIEKGALRLSFCDRSTVLTFAGLEDKFQYHLPLNAQTPFFRFEVLYMLRTNGVR